MAGEREVHSNFLHDSGNQLDTDIYIMGILGAIRVQIRIRVLVYIALTSTTLKVALGIILVCQTLDRRRHPMTPRCPSGTPISRSSSKRAMLPVTPCTVSRAS